ncbi:hypothetical protein ACIRYZ_43590 [Kitasatospora sp. NPDC101155]|uniref:hypothetical protein n=1 Tax=Kitasatospora sp. NPDC101155 TaxID=3364097 RepID=UPI00382D0763
MRAVERWGDKGEALVGDESGRLVPAVKVPGFQKLVENHRVVAVLPAAPGWTVQSAQFGPFEPFTTPIGAWVMDGEGMFWPVIGVSEPKDGGPYRPSPDGEWVLRPHLSSGNKIVPPKD